jgi:hypothetical protein
MFGESLSYLFGHCHLNWEAVLCPKFDADCLIVAKNLTIRDNIGYDSGSKFGWV